VTIPFSPPDIGQEEIRAVAEVLKSGWITSGPVTRSFEDAIASYVGVPRAVCLNSATAAMEAVLRLFEVGPGDEVITSAYTYTASASVIAHVGATIKLCDVAPGSYHLDPAELDRLITPRTKAIIPVDIGGVMCDYDTIRAVIDAHESEFAPASQFQNTLGRVLLLADAAHSFGSSRQGKQSGTVADFTAFSFHAVKNLTTAEGGAIVWRPGLGLRDDEIDHRLHLMILHGQTKDAMSKMKAGAWEYDVIAPLYKWNMTDIMAAIGLVQLQRYDGMLARRRELVAMYESGLAGSPVEFIRHAGEDYASNCHLMLTRVLGGSSEQRNTIIESLVQQGIACNVHFKPLSILTAYRNLGFRAEDYPHAIQQYENEITLPLHTLLTDEDVRYVVKNYREAVNVLDG
jgi:dTDP-4-amino-4,6-dideoxygalactose transaminase